MKKFLIYTFLICVNSNLNAQINYLNYNKGIINAESKFLNNNYSDAIKDYKILFETYPKAFAKDCYIAAQIATLNKDTSSLKTFLGYCFLKGIEIEAIRNDSTISKFITQYPLYNKHLDSLYEKNYLVYLNKIDLVSRLEIETIVKRDMLYHDLPYQLKKKYNKDSLYGKILDENTLKFIDLVHQKGFLGEQNLGIKNIKLDEVSHCINNDYNYKLNDISDLIYFHHQCTYFNLKKELENALKNGDIQPRMFAHFYEWAYSALKAMGDTSVKGYFINDNGSKIPIYNTQIKKMNCKNVELQTKIYHVYRGEEAVPEIDKKTDEDREEIGICSLKHEWSKKEFERSHHLKLFFGMFGEL